jgi:hypothetical protein
LLPRGTEAEELMTKRELLDALGASSLGMDEDVQIFVYEEDVTAAYYDVGHVTEVVNTFSIGTIIETGDFRCGDG